MICSDLQIKEFISKIESIETNDNGNFHSFLIGCPRSGTTVLNQAIVYCSDVTYINNLVARFHWCPELGMIVSKDLNISKRWVGKSDYGRTTDVSEPHEFGAFWRSVLGQESMFQKNSVLDLDLLNYKLSRISKTADSTTIFKVFQLIWHIVDLHQSSTICCKWVYVKRDLFSNCMSILKLRLERGSISNWTSLVPISAEKYSDPYEQIVAQVIGINSWIDNQLRDIDFEFSHRVAYEEFCSDVVGTLEGICNFMGVEFFRNNAIEIAETIKCNPSKADVDEKKWQQHTYLMERAIDRVLQ